MRACAFIVDDVPAAPASGRLVLRARKRRTLKWLFLSGLEIGAAAATSGPAARRQKQIKILYHPEVLQHALCLRFVGSMTL